MKNNLLFLYLFLNYFKQKFNIKYERSIPLSEKSSEIFKEIAKISPTTSTKISNVTEKTYK